MECNTFPTTACLNSKHIPRIRDHCYYCMPLPNPLRETTKRDQNGCNSLKKLLCLSLFYSSYEMEALIFYRQAVRHEAAFANGFWTCRRRHHNVVHLSCQVLGMYGQIGLAVNRYPTSIRVRGRDQGAFNVQARVGMSVLCTYTNNHCNKSTDPGNNTVHWHHY